MSGAGDQTMSRQQRMLFGLCLGVALAMSAAPAWCAEPYSLEPATAQASAYLPQSLVDGIDPQGTRLFTYVNGLKMPISEIFWARSVMEQEPPAGPSKILYRSLKPGALLGVIHFFAETSEDYR